jgi:hypothetical protein
VALVGPAIARGNTVVAIPSSRYPLSATDLYQVFDTSDLPAGVVNIVTGNRDHLTKTLVDHEDVKWIGSFEGGLTRLEGSEWQTYSVQNSGLPSNWVRSIAIDNADVKWIGTAEGLARFDGEDWDVFNTSNSGLPEDRLYGIDIEGDDIKWIATEGGGLASFDGEIWEVFTTDNSGIPFGTLICVTVDNSTKKWIGSFGAGLTTYLDNIPSGKAEDLLKPIPGFVFHQNYPNPFNPETTIRYRVAERKEIAFSPYIELTIYTVTGQEVTTLVSEKHTAGEYTVRWDASGLPGGIYFSRLTARGHVAREISITRKLILIK